MNHPPQWPPQQPQYRQQWPTSPYPAPAPRKNKLVLLLVLAPVLIVALVIVGLVGYYVIEEAARGGPDGRGGNREASSLASFEVVCDHGSISNAAMLSKPYKIAAFGPNVQPMPLTRKGALTQLTLDPGADYTTTPDAFRSVNVVACLTQKPGTSGKARACAVDTKEGEHVTFDYYSVQYNIEVREARTGKRIEQLPAVNGSASSCPFLLWVDTYDRIMYAAPDLTAVEAELAEFTHR